MLDSCCFKCTPPDAEASRDPKGHHWLFHLSHYTHFSKHYRLACTKQPNPGTRSTKQRLIPTRRMGQFVRTSTTEGRKGKKEKQPRHTRRSKYDHNNNDKIHNKHRHALLTKILLSLLFHRFILFCSLTARPITAPTIIKTLQEQIYTYTAGTGGRVAEINISDFTAPSCPFYPRTAVCSL